MSFKRILMAVELALYDVLLVVLLILFPVQLGGSEADIDRIPLKQLEVNPPDEMRLFWEKYN